MVELRRALLLFAIVLGLAAIATSISRPPDKRDGDRAAAPPPSAPPAPTARPRPSSGPPVEVTFERSPRRLTESIDVSRPATVVVEVPEPGQVELVGLGLSAAAEPLTPARFDVLSARDGRHQVRLDPSSGRGSRVLGTLEIGSGASRR